MRYILFLFLVLMPASSMAEKLPIPDGTIPIGRTHCTDNESGATGLCIMGEAPDGTIYLLFLEGGQPSFIRKTTPDQGYETIWKAGGIVL